MEDYNQVSRMGGGRLLLPPMETAMATQAAMASRAREEAAQCELRTLIEIELRTLANWGRKGEWEWFWCNGTIWTVEMTALKMMNQLMPRMQRRIHKNTPIYFSRATVVFKEHQAEVEENNNDNTRGRRKIITWDEWTGPHRTAR